MALTLGSVSVADNGIVTKSGCTGRLYDELAALAGAELPGGIPAGSDGVPIKRAQAKLATTLAQWFYTEITTIITAKIPAGDPGASLQRTPNPNDPDTDTKGPSVDKFLSLV